MNGHVDGLTYNLENDIREDEMAYYFFWVEFGEPARDKNEERHMEDIDEDVDTSSIGALKAFQ